MLETLPSVMKSESYWGDRVGGEGVVGRHRSLCGRPASPRRGGRRVAHVALGTSKEGAEEGFESGGDGPRRGPREGL